MNFSKIARDSWVGTMLRAPLGLIPPNMVMPIWQGRLRGTRWIVGSGTHGYWLGSYECDKQELFARVVTPKATVFDVGAHTGFYTLLASHLVGPQGRVIAFEPLPQNVDYLRRHLLLNHVTNVTIFDLAVSDRRGVTSFQTGNSTYTGHLSTSGQMEVNVTSLDTLIAEGQVMIPQIITVHSLKFLA